MGQSIEVRGGEVGSGEGEEEQKRQDVLHVEVLDLMLLF